MGESAPSVNITYSDIQGGEEGISTSSTGTVTWGSGNIDTDPFFVNAANGDYSLLAGSQCIAAAPPDGDGDNITWDTDYDDRDPDMTRPDMGCLLF